MKPFIPYEKLSKKQKRRIDSEKRSGFGQVNPVSRRKDSAKLYSRKRTRRNWENPYGAFFVA